MVYEEPYIFYYTDLTERKSTGSILPAGISIECCKSDADISQQDRKALLAHLMEKNLRRNIEERFAKGALFWLVKVDGELAGFIWTIRGATVEPYINPLTADDVHLCDNLMFEEFRGRGINKVLLNFVLYEMQKQHCVYVYCETHITNTPEIRTLAKEDFHKRGLAKKRLFWMHKRSYFWRKLPPAWIDFNEKQIETQVFESFDLLQGIQPEWDSFVEATCSDIFLTYDWCRIWWKYYGVGRDLSIFIFRAGGRIVGIIPLFLENIRLGLLSVRVAKIVGSDFTLSQFSIPVKTEYMTQALKAFSVSMTKRKWDVLYLGPIAGVYQDFERLAESFAQCLPEARHVVVGRHNVQTYFEINGDFDKYVSGLNKKERSNIRRSYKGIASYLPELSQPFESSFAQKSNFDEYFNDFVLLHKLHWNKLGKAGHFSDWPCAEEFHREVAEINQDLGRLRLLKVGKGDRCFGYEYSYKIGQKYYQLLNACSNEEISNDISFGRINFCELIKKAIEDKVILIDSMRGIYKHKLRLGGKLVPMRALYVVQGSVSANIKVLLLQATAYVVNFCYYKLWYCRIVPKLSLARKPLWKIWIRINAFMMWGAISVHMGAIYILE
jgi:CelD/BcsL family acetyltransferase involved in cellulose biosynthesis/GNAT superfamily N-acetyltransferase